MSGWSRERAGVALTLGAALLWGTSWVGTGFALRGFSPLAVAGWRGLVGLAFIAVYIGLRPSALRDDHERPRAGRAARVVLLGLLGGGLFQVGLAYAVDLSGATLAAFVAGLYPILAAAGAGLVLGERPGAFVLGGLLVAFGGVVLLAGFDPTGASPAGLAIGLAAATSFAAYLLLTRRWAAAWRLPTPLVTTSLLAMTALVALPLALFTDPAGLVPRAARCPSWRSCGWPDRSAQSRRPRPWRGPSAAERPLGGHLPAQPADGRPPRGGAAWRTARPAPGGRLRARAGRRGAGDGHGRTGRVSRHGRAERQA